MHESLQNAVSRMLRPLVRLLLRHGVSHAEFCNWAKQAYVNEAVDHFSTDGKNLSVSRIAIVTGINRKEVKRIRDLPSEVITGISKRNRAVRVITGWLQDAQFHDTESQPAVLTYGDSSDSFNQLVKIYGGDVPARAMLDELVRVGTVEHQDGAVSLLKQGYIPQQSEEAMLEIFSTSAADLLTTLDHNLAYPDRNRLQMSVAYDKVTADGVAHFRKISSAEALKLLRAMDQQLSAFDSDANPDLIDEGNHRVGIGVYFIEDGINEHGHDEN